MAKLGALLLVFLISACAGTQRSPSTRDTGPVSLGSWCEEVTATLCHATADRCARKATNFEAGCQQSAREACLGGRDRALSSGRNTDELRQCVKQIDRLACPELSATSGALAEACAAKASAPIASGQP